MLTKKNPGKAVWIAASAAILLAGCSPSGPELLLRGDKQMREGKTAEAVRSLEQAVELLPDDARAWNHLGLAYNAAGNTEEARKAYARAVQFDPNFPDPHYNLGTMEFELGRYAEAEPPLRTFLAWQPRRADAWAHLGQTQFQLRQFDAAERSLASALQLDRNDAESWNTLGMIQVQRKRYRDAVQQFAEAVRLAPTHAAARLNLAVTTHQYIGDRRAALQQYREYVALNPQPADAEAVRGLIRQLEAQLGLGPRVTNAPVLVAATNAPATLVSTNLVRVLTNPAPRVPFAVTNALTARAVATNPAAAAVKPAVTAPPTNAASIAITPPVAVRTNLATARSNAPVAVVPTNPAPLAMARVVTNPPAVRVAAQPPAPVTNPPAATPPPPPPKPTVVKVEEPPAFLPARDRIAPPVETPKPAVPTVETPAPTVAAPSPTPPSPVPEPSTPPVVSVETTTAAETPAGGVEKPGARKSILQRMNPVGWFRHEEPPKPAEPKPEKAEGGSKLNPVNWFRGKDKDKEKDKLASAPPPPLVESSRPAAGSVLPPSSARLELPPSGPSPVAALESSAPPEPVVSRPPARPAPPRYTRTLSSAPAAGDRNAAQTQFNAAMQAYERRDFATAQARYQQAVTSDPTLFEAQHNLALTALNTGDLPLALTASEAALLLRPDSVSARWNYALALQRAKYPADAAEEFEKYAAAEATNGRAHLALGGLYALELDDPDRARTHYSRFLELDPQHPQAANVRQWIQLHPAR